MFANLFRLVMFVALFMPFSAQADLSTVDFVDLNLYAGRWYQIAHNPLFFEDGCVCSIQDLSALSPTEIHVKNSCRSQTINGATREIAGVATVEDAKTNAKLKVDFGLPQKGDYWVIGLDPQYRYAVVSDPSMKSLYILSKTPSLSADLYAEAVATAGKQVSTAKLVETLQAGCTYP